MNLYLFNPDNDLALANNDDNYRSPASARKMGSDLTPLMGWIAGDGDFLLFPENTTWQPDMPLYPDLKSCSLPELHEEFEKDQKRWLNIQHNGSIPQPKNHTQKENPIKFFNSITKHLYGNDLLKPNKIIPWGWNPSLVRQLTNAGIDTSLLPSSKVLEEIKHVSHRSQSVKALRFIRNNASEELKNILCGKSYEIFSEKELKQLIETPGKEWLLKAPLSGSGRGLIRSMGHYKHPVSGWCKNTLEMQGSVILEPYYNKVCDFAMEFRTLENCTIHFAGYSLFETNAHGSYTRNILMTDKAITSLICNYGFKEQYLKELQHILSQILSKITKDVYQGWLGVDMMICMENGHYRIHPCVEINARFTMGVFSRLFYDRYITPGVKGSFGIRFSPKNGALLQYAAEAFHKNPLRICNNRFTSGWLALTPVTENTRFLAEVNLLPSTSGHPTE